MWHLLVNHDRGKSHITIYRSLEQKMAERPIYQSGWFEGNDLNIADKQLEMIGLLKEEQNIDGKITEIIVIENARPERPLSVKTLTINQFEMSLIIPATP